MRDYSAVRKILTSSSTLIIALLVFILPALKAEATDYGDTISHPCSSALGYGCNTPVNPHVRLSPRLDIMRSQINRIHNNYQQRYGQHIPLNNENINKVMRLVGAQPVERSFVVNQLRGMASLDDDLVKTMKILQCTDAYGNLTC